MKKTYWTMNNGQKIDVDTMDITHLRNTLKMIIRNKEIVFNNLIKNAQPIVKPKFQIHGDIAQNHMEQMFEEDYYCDSNYKY
jgi:hypothetical protein